MEMPDFQRFAPGELQMECWIFLVLYQLSVLTK
jgi:hypothetical protein